MLCLYDLYIYFAKKKKHKKKILVRIILILNSWRNIKYLIEKYNRVNSIILKEKFYYNK